MNQALNSQKTPHTSPVRASYGMSFVSILMKNDRVIKGFYCILFETGSIQEIYSQHCGYWLAGALAPVAPFTNMV